MGWCTRPGPPVAVCPPASTGYPRLLHPHIVQEASWDVMSPVFCQLLLSILKNVEVLQAHHNGCSSKHA